MKLLEPIALEFTGTYAECTAYVESQLATYPTAYCCTWFNWPPDKRLGGTGLPITYLLPVEHIDGLWTVRGHRRDPSNNSWVTNNGKYAPFWIKS